MLYILLIIYIICSRTCILFNSMTSSEAKKAICKFQKPILTNMRTFNIADCEKKTF